jgi:YVTN family beta-propeller protein
VAGIALAAIAVLVTFAVTSGLAFRPAPGVGGDSSPSPSSSPPPAGPSASVGPSATVGPFGSPIHVEPTAVIPVDAPLALASDGTSIWLFTAKSDLVRIDPRTASVAASVRLDLSPDAFQGLAGDRAGLWVTDWNGSRVERFDPQTLRSVTSIGTAAASKGVLVAGGSVWVANTRGGSVQRIDPKTNTVTATIPVGPLGPSGPNWLAVGLGSIWVSVPNTGSVVRIGLASNAVQASIPVPGPATPCGGLAAGSTAVWVTSCDGTTFVAQIDPVTNTTVGEIDLGGNGYTFAMAGDRPWISPKGSQLVRLDPVGHGIDRGIVPGTGFSGGGDVVVAAGSLWVIDGAANRILRLPLAALGG